MLFFVLFWNILKFLWNMYSVRWKIAAVAKSANPCIAFIQKTRKNRILIDRSRTLNSVNKIIIDRICATQNHCLTINPNCWLKKRDIAKKDYCSAYKLVLYSIKWFCNLIILSICFKTMNSCYIHSFFTNEIIRFVYSVSPVI